MIDRARQLRGFDLSRFQGCLASKRVGPKIDMDLAVGKRLGVSGTPTVFVNGERVSAGAVPEQIRTLIRESIAR